jgi:polyhydroxyalkanoate synthesis regulator phasin
MKARAKLVNESLNEFVNPTVGNSSVEELQRRLDKMANIYKRNYEVIDPEEMNATIEDNLNYDEYDEEFLESGAFEELLVWDQSHGDPVRPNIQEIIDLMVDEGRMEPSAIPAFLDQVKELIDFQDHILGMTEI